MNLPRRVTISVFCVFCFLRSLHAEEHAITLSIDDYTARAITQGIQGQENALTFESAGYTREVAFRLTDSPTLNATASGKRDETQTTGPSPLTDPLFIPTGNGVFRTDTAEGDLTLNELLPTGTKINAQGQTLGTQTSGLGADANSTQKIFTASVMQPLYIFVKNSVMRTRREADLNFANARDNFDSTVLSLRAQARNLYYQVMLGEESIKSEERKVASSRKLLDITQALVQGGKSAPVETMRAKITLQEDERQLQNAIVTRAKAVLNAKNFIYMPLEDDVYFSTRLEFKPLQMSVERLVQFAILHNPQLKTLRRQQELAELALQTATETTRPTLALNSTYNYTQVSPSLTRDWTISGTANWLFFDSFVTRDNVSIAGIGVTIAHLNLSEAERTTQLNINNAYLDLKNAEKQIQDFASSIDQAHHNVDVVRLRFRSGLERLIDVFDAENNMLTVDNEYQNLVVSFNQQKDTLSQLVGADVETIR